MKFKVVFITAFSFLCNSYNLNTNLARANGPDLLAPPEVSVLDALKGKLQGVRWHRQHLNSENEEGRAERAHNLHMLVEDTVAFLKQHQLLAELQRWPSFRGMNGYSIVEHLHPRELDLGIDRAVTRMGEHSTLAVNRIIELEGEFPELRINFDIQSLRRATAARPLKLSTARAVRQAWEEPWTSSVRQSTSKKLRAARNLMLAVYSADRSFERIGKSMKQNDARRTLRRIGVAYQRAARADGWASWVERGRHDSGTSSRDAVSERRPVGH